MPTPIVLTTSPAEVVLPVHRQTSGLPDHALRVLAPRSAPALLAAAPGADILLGDWTGELRLDRAVLDAARRCRLIVQPTAGYDSIDIEAARSLGIPVVNAPGANARAVAEWTVMAILMLLKNAVVNHERTKRGEWWMLAATAEGVRDLGGRTVGILGLGRIGLGVARRLDAFGVERILYHHRSAVPESRTAGLPLERVAEVDELCARSDVLTLHIPLTPETRHLIDRRRLRLLGPDGVLVNTARGAIADEDALYAALAAGEIKGAALDVFSAEPLAGAHRWAELGNVFLSPHLAGSTVQARAAMLTAGLTAVAAGLRGRLPAEVVNGVGALRDPCARAGGPGQPDPRPPGRG